MPFSRNQRLITVYIRPHYWILTSVRWIQGVSTYRVSLMSIFILSPHRHLGFPTARYPSGPALHSVRMSHPSHITTYPVHTTVLHKITLTTLCDWLTKNSVPIEKPTVAHPVKIFSTWWNSKAHYSFSRQYSVEQDKQRMYNITRWRVRVAIVAKENRQRVLCVLLSYTSVSKI